MRVCFVSRRYFPAISGMSVYAQNLLRELVAAGHDVTLVSQYRSDAFGTSVYGGGPPPPVPGVEVIGLEATGEQGGPGRPSGDFESDIAAMVAAIAAAHRRRPFDVLHAQYGYPTGWATLLASRETGVANIVSIQGGDGHWVGSCCETHRQAMVGVLEHAGAVLIGGRSFVKEVSGRLGTDPARFTIVPGAVDTARFHPAGEDRDGAAPVRLLYHGRVDRRKGVLDMLEALRTLAARGADFHATISGIGPDQEASVARAAELGLGPNRVAFTGYADYGRVPDIYRRADAFVSPTHAEGFSNTILEAMASGLAIVSCRSVGVVDCLRDGETALLSEPGDVPALTDALERVVRDVALRRRLARAALVECRRVYSWSSVARQIIAVYERLAGTRPDLAFSPDLPMTPCRFRAQPHLL